MSLGKYIGIHAQGDANFLFQSSSPFGQQPQLALTLDVEDQDVGLDGRVYLLSRLSYAGEDDALRRARSEPADAFQLSARDHIEGGAQLRQKMQDRKIRVRFHGIADGMRYAAECAIEFL